ncbi:MAG: hypothetical protein KC931_00585 [Candidatus Omnitrophica bacterium]|nr:hypothetical protein [Candidatus Omnitrophota bacterium]
MNQTKSSLVGHILYAIGVLLALALAAWVRFHILAIYEDNKGLLEASSRTQTAMVDARKILKGQGFSGLFGSETGGYNADDTGFAIYIAAVWSLTGETTLSSLQSATVYLDLLALLFLILALSRVFNRTTGIIAGILYALYLPVPIQIAHSNNHVLVVQFALLIISWILLLPRHWIAQTVIVLLVGLFFLFANTVRSVFGPFAFLIGFFLFVKYGKRRGLLLGLLFLAVVMVGNLCLKVAMGNPSHQVWHALYVGLGEFPNPYGLTGLDTEGNEEAGRVSPGIDMYTSTDDYMEVIKHRALARIDENPGYYFKTLWMRTHKVLVGYQDWFFVGFGLRDQTAKTVAWTIFLMGWAGIVLSFIWKKWDAFLLFMGYLYFSLCVVPLLATHAAYYVAGSLLLLPFAAFFLSSLRLIGVSKQELPDSSAWENGFRTDRWILGFIAAGILTTAIGTAAFLAYAGKDAANWKSEFLARIDENEPIDSWTESSLPEVGIHREVPSVTATVQTPGVPHLFEILLDVTKGKIGMELRDANNEPITPPTYSAGVGANRCYVGWTPNSAGEVRLHIWEALPRDYPDHYDRDEGEYIEETFRHYGLVDYAKLEFFPDNEIEVSASFFPNGHETIPYLLDKERPTTNEATTIPKYWAAGVPCWTQLEFAAPRRIDRVICQLPNERIDIAPPYLQLRPDNQPNFRSPMTLRREVLEEGREVRFTFSELEVAAVQIKFDQAGNDRGLAYVQDISIPEPADFKLDSIRLYQGTDENKYPSSLSFITSEEFSP